MRGFLTVALIAFAGCQATIKEGHRPDGGHVSAPDAGDPGTMTDGSVTMIDAPVMMMTPELFLSGWETDYCAAAFMCQNTFPNNTGTTFQNAFGNSPTQCQSILNAYDNPTQVETDITAGKITWSATNAQTCLDQLKTFQYSCNSFWNPGANYPNACATSLVGHVGNGNSCGTDWDCAWTSYCNNGKCSAN